MEAVDSHIIIFHDYNEEIQRQNGDWDLEVCVPVDKSVKCDIRGRNIATRIIEGRTYAKTVHIGGFNKIGRAHAAVIDWINANNLKICGAPLEKYLTARQIVFNPKSFEVEVYYPVED